MEKLLNSATEEQLRNLLSRASQSYTKAEAINALLSNKSKMDGVIPHLPNEVLTNFLETNGVSLTVKEKNRQTLAEKTKHFLQASANPKAEDTSAEEVKKKMNLYLQELAIVTYEGKALAGKQNEVADKQLELVRKLETLAEDEGSLERRGLKEPKEEK